MKIYLVISANNIHQTPPLPPPSTTTAGAFFPPFLPPFLPITTKNYNEHAEFLDYYHTDKPASPYQNFPNFPQTQHDTYALEMRWKCYRDERVIRTPLDRQYYQYDIQNGISLRPLCCSNPIIAHSEDFTHQLPWCWTI